MLEKLGGGTRSKGGRRSLEMVFCLGVLEVNLLVYSLHHGWLLVVFQGIDLDAVHNGNPLALLLQILIGLSHQEAHNDDCHVIAADRVGGVRGETFRNHL